MGKKYKGFLEFNSNFKVIKPAPLDDRIVVNSFADLLSIDNAYVGLAVTVIDERTIYVLAAEDPTLAESWQKISGLAELAEDQLAAIAASKDLVDSGVLQLSTNKPEGENKYQLNLATLVPATGALQVGTGENEGRLILNTSELIAPTGGLTLNADNKIEVNTGNGLEVSDDGKVQVALSEEATGTEPGLGFDNEGKLKINFNMLYDIIGGDPVE